MKQFAEWMVRCRRAMLLAGLAITACLLPFARNVRYDQSVHALFSSDDPRLLAYNRTAAEFGGDATCLAVYTDPDLLSAAGMARLRDFTRKLSQVKGVLSAHSLAEMPRLREPELWRNAARWLASGGVAASGSTPLWRPLADWFTDANADFDALRREILACAIYVDVLVAKDGQTAAVVMQIDRTAMGSGAFATGLRELRALAAAFRPGPAVIVGSPAMISDVYEYMIQDLQVMTYCSVLLMGLVIFVVFRSLRWVLLPLAIVQATLIWTKALMHLADVRLSIVGAMTAAMVTVIGVATVIHIALRYREESQRDHDHQAALVRALVHVLPAVFWACLTTSAGFGALMVSRVAPVRDYGWLMAYSGMFDCLSAFLFIPGGALLFGRLRTEPREALGEDALERALGQLVAFVVRHSVVTSLLMLPVILVALWGCTRVEVETDFTRNFRRGSKTIEGYQYVEERLGGVGVIDLVFDAPVPMVPEFLDRVRRCEEAIRKVPGVVKVTGLTTALDFIRESLGAEGVFGFMPDSVLLDAKLHIMRLAQPEVYRQLYNPEVGRMRLVVRVREQTAVRDKNERLAAIRAIAEQQLGPSVDVTGLHVLLVFIVDSLLGDQWLSFSVACLVILTMTAVAFRSLRLGLVAFLPNLIPIAIVLGLMGWAGWKINVATAMINSIALGLVIDFGHHYVARFVDERREGADFYTALSRTHISTGKAVFFANLALSLGFLVLIFSNFMPTVQFGLLISIATFCGLIGNLVMLPVLLRLAYWNEAREKP